MDVKIIKIDSALSAISNIYTLLCQGDVNDAFKCFSEALTDINEILTKLLDDMPKLCQYGIDIPADIVLKQLNNMLEAFENRDIIMLADTLHYEISDTLQFYKEIVQECIKKNIELQK